MPGIGVGANYLRILLDDPEMQALIAAAPQIGRTLRPFWHMLSGEPLPPLLQQRPRPAEAPRAPPPETPHAEPAAPPHPKPPPARRGTHPPRLRKTA